MKSDGDSMDATSEGLVRRCITVDANFRLFLLFETACVTNECLINL